MLSSLREMLRSKLATVIIGVLILSLAVVGVTDIIRGSFSQTLARAGSETLELDAFQRRVADYRQQALAESDEIIELTDMAADGTLDQLFSEQLTRLMQYGYASRLGLKASNAAIVSELRTRGAPSDPETGRIDLAAYIDTLDRNQNTTPAQYEREVRADITIDNLRTAMVSSLVVPDILVRPTYDLLTERREIEWVVLPAAALPEPPVPTEEDIAAFYAENSEALTIPERRALSALAFSEADFIGVMTYTDERLREIHAAEPDRFRAPPVANWTSLIYADRDTANAALARLSIGTPLADLSADLAPAATVPGSGQKASIADVAIAEALFGPLAEDGAVFGPFDDTTGNVRLIRLENITPGDVRPFEVVRDQIASELARKDAEIRYADAREQALSMLAAGRTLEEIAAAIGTPVIAYAPVLPTGVTGDGVRLTVADYAEALAQSQDLLEGEVTDPFSPRVNPVPEDPSTPKVEHLVLLRVDRIVAPYLPPLEELRPLLLANLSIQKAATAVADYGSAMKLRLESGETDLATVAASVGAVVNAPPGGIDRRNVPEDWGNNLTNGVFVARSGEYVVVPNRLGGVTAARIGNIRLVPEDAEAGVPQVRTVLTGSVSEDLLIAGFSAMQAAIDVKVDERRYPEYRASLQTGR